MICPSVDPGKFTYHRPWMMNSDMDELSDIPSDGGAIAMYYSVRPEAEHWFSDDRQPIDENLVRLSDYADLAIITENLYMRYPQNQPEPGYYEVFHGSGSVTGYGDGHVKFVEGGDWLERLHVDRSRAFYKTAGDGWPKPGGVWWQLDQAF